MIVPEEEDVANLSFPANVPELEELIRPHAADLVVIDPSWRFCRRASRPTPTTACAAASNPSRIWPGGQTAPSCSFATSARRRAGAPFYRGLGSIGFVATARRACSPLAIRPTHR